MTGVMTSHRIMDKPATYWRILASSQGEGARFLCDETGGLVEPTPEAIQHLKALLAEGYKSVITRG